VPKKVDWPVKELIVAQSLLELVLLVLLLAVLWRTRKRKAQDPAAMPDRLRAGIERFLTESEKIATAFALNLKDKKELSSALILKLDRRLAEYRALLSETERRYQAAMEKLEGLNQAGLAAAAQLQEQGTKANPAAPEVRALVSQLAKKGLSIEEIAQKARLHRGEVELIIDLEKQFDL
jgi:hypothetical protein